MEAQEVSLFNITMYQLLVSIVIFVLMFLMIAGWVKFVIEKNKKVKKLQVNKSHLAKLMTLSNKELLYFSFFLEGDDNNTIMKKMEIKDTTLKTHRRNTFKKLGINTVNELNKFADEYFYLLNHNTLEDI